MLEQRGYPSVPLDIEDLRDFAPAASGFAVCHGRR
jgi:hypothetical protein